MEIYLGFDPGGKGQFGLSICLKEGGRLQIVKTGNANHAEGVLSEIKENLPPKSTVMGAGIDAPLFWAANGIRHSDLLVRNAIKKLGSKSPGGTVQQLNSLRGACLVQDPLIAKLLADEFPEISITESHPKALLFMLGLANAEIKPNQVGINDLHQYIKVVSGNYTEHERDSVLGAIASMASVGRYANWRNLAEEEKGLLAPLAYSVGYWMPWGLAREIT